MNGNKVLADRGLQLVVGLLVGLLLALLALVINLNREVGETKSVMNGKFEVLDTKITLANGRVDNVLNALPALRVRIAYEEITNPLAGAVVTTKPAQDETGKWYATIYVLDFVAKQKTMYRVALKGPDDPAATFAARGAAPYPEWPGAATFSELDQWSIDNNKRLPVAPYIDPDASFGFFQGDSKAFLKTSKDLSSYADMLWGPSIKSTYGITVTGAAVTWGSLATDAWDVWLGKK